MPRCEDCQEYDIPVQHHAADYSEEHRLREALSHIATSASHIPGYACRAYAKQVIGRSRRGQCKLGLEQEGDDGED